MTRAVWFMLAAVLCLSGIERGLAQYVAGLTFEDCEPCDAADLSCALSTTTTCKWTPTYLAPYPACLDGEYLDVDTEKNKYTCRICPGGTWRGEVRHNFQTCNDCPRFNLDTYTFSVTPFFLDNGVRATNTQPTACVQCNPNSEPNVTLYQSAVDNYYDYENTTWFRECVCKANYGFDQGGQVLTNPLDGRHCVPCAEGKHKAFAANIPCCQPGQVYDFEAEGCVQCEAGKFQDLYCITCPAGKVSSEGQAECDVCAANTYQDGNECKQCENYFSSDPGSTLCHTDRCIDGYRFDDDLGCLQCPAGFKLVRRDLASPSSEDECVICPVNTYSAAGSMHCTQCSMHHTAPQGSAACTPCPYTSNDASGLLGSYLFEAEVAAGVQECHVCDTSATSCASGACCEPGFAWDNTLYENTKTMTMVAPDVKLFYSANNIVELPGVYLTDGTDSWNYDNWEQWFSDKKEACEEDSTCFVLQCQMSHTCWEEQIISERYACLQTSGYVCYSYSDPLFIPLIEEAQTSLAGSTDSDVRIYYGDAGNYLHAFRQDETRFPTAFRWKDPTTRGVWVKKQECCTPCADATYSQYVDMQPCAACNAGYTHEPQNADVCTRGLQIDPGYTDPDEPDPIPCEYDKIEPNCLACAKGSYARATDTVCKTCAAGKYSDEAYGECSDCPRGKYMGTQEEWSERQRLGNYGAWQARWIEQCVESCQACGEQKHRVGCKAFSAGTCEDCKSCPAGFSRVGCVHYENYTFYDDEEAGRCVDSSVLVRAPQCPQEVSGVAEPVSPDLSGFTFEQVFGQPQTTLIDFQCRQTCIGRTEDTTYCTGPHACNRPACTMVRTEDGAPDYLVARGCPVLLPDVDMNGRAVVDLSETEESLLTKARTTECQTCATCGSDPPVGATDWGLGCAVECSQLECDAGEIFDYTAPAGTKCRACSELTDFRLCSTADQEKLDVNTDSVSGLGQLLRWSGCRPKPGSVDVAGDAGGPASYGPCEACEPPECGQNEYPHTCTECVSCRLRNVDQMYQGLYVNATFDPHPVFCQLPPCADERTAVENTGEVCVRECIPPGECAADTHELPCRLPHDTRCLQVEPVRPAGAERRGVMPAHANVLEIVPGAVREGEAPALVASFENVLLNLREDDWHQHQCVWDALGIVDNHALPGGLSATMLTPADDVSAALGEVGTKHCRPIGEGAFPRWDRDPRRSLRLVPLQNTVLEVNESLGQLPATTPRRALLNGTASVMAYGSGMVLGAIHTTQPVAPAGVAAGDLLLALNLQQAANVSVLLPIPVERGSPAWLLEHGAWQLSLVVQELQQSETVLRPLRWDLGLAIGGVMQYTDAMDGLRQDFVGLAMTVFVGTDEIQYTSRTAAEQAADVALPAAMLRLYGARRGVKTVNGSCYALDTLPEGFSDEIPADEAQSDTAVLGRLALRSSGALLDDDELLRATLVQGLRMPVVAQRMGPTGSNFFVLATPQTVEVRALLTGAQWANQPTEPVSLQALGAFLVLDVAVAGTSTDGSYDVFALVQQADSSKFMHALCATEVQTCTAWQLVAREGQERIMAFDAARVTSGIGAPVVTVVHALQVREIASEASALVEIRWLQWLLVRDSSSTSLRLQDDVEAILSLPQDVSLDFVGAHSSAVAVAPSLSDPAGGVRALAAVPLSRTHRSDLAQKTFDVALHVRLPSTDLHSLGWTYMLTDVAAENGDTHLAARLRALFSNEPRVNDNLAAVQCRAGLVWLRARAFVVAWPCASVVIRGEMARASDGSKPRLSLTSLSSRSALTGQSFSHAPLCAVLPPDNTLLVLATRLASGAQTVPLAQSVVRCLPGFVRSTEALADLVEVVTSAAACGLWCAARPSCQAYSTFGGECRARLQAPAGDRDAVPSVCIREPSARSTLVSRTLLDAVGLRLNAPAGVHLVDSVSRAVHLRGFRPLAPGNITHVAGLVCRPPGDATSTSLLEMVVATVPPPHELRAQAVASGVLQVPVIDPSQRLLGDQEVTNVELTLSFSQSPIAIVADVPGKYSVKITFGTQRIPCKTCDSDCRVAIFMPDSQSVSHGCWGKTSSNSDIHRISLYNSGALEASLSVVASSETRFVRIHVGNVPVRSLDELWTLTSAGSDAATVAGEVPRGKWARPTLRLPATLPARAFAALTVARAANYVDDSMDDIEQIDAAEWPTRGSTRLTRVVGVDAFELLPVLSRPHSGSPGWRVYVPSEEDLSELNLDSAYSHGRATDSSWPRVHARVALNGIAPGQDGDDAETWTARLIHLKSDGTPYDDTEQGALALLGCDFPRLGVRQCYLQLPLQANGDAQTLGLDITCANADGGPCAKALDPHAVAVTIPPFMALNECGNDELLSHSSECVPCAEAEDETEEDCPLGERRAVCVELRPPAHRHGKSCETCDVTGRQQGTYEWTPPSSVFQGNWNMFHTDDALGDDLAKPYLTHLGAPSDENVAKAAASCAASCNADLDKCRWFFLHISTISTRCLYPSSSAAYNAEAVITPPSDRSRQQVVESWIFAPDTTNAFFLYYMTPAPPCTWQCKENFYRDGDSCAACGSSPTCPAGQRLQQCGGLQPWACVACELPFGAEYDEHGALYNIEWQEDGAECAYVCKPGFYKDTDNICQECTNWDGLQLLLAAVPTTHFYRFDSCRTDADAALRRCEDDSGQVVYTAHAKDWNVDCPAYCERDSANNDFRAVEGTAVTCEPCPQFQSSGWPFTPTREPQSGCEPICPEGWGRATHANFRANEFNVFLTQYPTACRKVDESGCAQDEYLDVEECLAADIVTNTAIDCSGGSGTQHLDFCEDCSTTHTLKSHQHFERVDGQSCTPRCDTNYFWHAGADEGFGACLLHAVHAGGCIPANGYYWAKGNADFDAVCLPCSKCLGQNLKTPCTEDSDAECEPCIQRKAENAHWIGNTCEKSECDDGFVRNLQASASTEAEKPCEQCAHVCPLGEHFNTPRQHCTDCVPCPPKPDNAEWSGPDNSCAWACLDDATVFVTATGVTLCQQSRAASVYNDSLAASAPLSTRLLCGARQFLNTSYQCQSCVGRVPTPPHQEENATWIWTANATACQWQCLRLFVLFVDAVGARHCLTWDQYHSSALLGLTTARVDRQFAQRFARIETRQERLAALDLVQLAVVLVTCAVLIARGGGARSASEEGAGGKV